VPGAGIGEFWPDHYAIGIAEYRYELFFFTYLRRAARGAWLDRDRLRSNNTTHRENNTLKSLGMRLTTGFLRPASVRLQLHQ
jgi:hypothetical protein